MAAIKNCAFGEPIPMQARSKSSARYKVGDEVLYAGERVKIIHVMITYHLADLSGEPIAMKVGEYLLDPADEATP